ncbi:MAG: hypothetical protein ACRDOK_21595 [Streptosporangiaceae bacterium]
MVEPVHAKGVLAEPDAGQLVAQVLVPWQVQPAAAEDLVQGQREPPTDVAFKVVLGHLDAV